MDNNRGKTCSVPNDFNMKNVHFFLKIPPQPHPANPGFLCVFLDKMNGLVENINFFCSEICTSLLGFAQPPSPPPYPTSQTVFNRPGVAGAAKTLRHLEVCTE